jgi:hypothetical protein
MTMQNFAFYPFGECYFFSEATTYNEGFFFKDNLAPTRSERGFSSDLKYIYYKKP